MWPLFFMQIASKPANCFLCFQHYSINNGTQHIAMWEVDEAWTVRYAVEMLGITKNFPV